MLSEDQVRAMLEECEAEIGQLSDLRARLLRHPETESSIFELLVLHSALRAGEAKHEPGDAQPDVVFSSSCGQIFIEVAWAKRRLPQEREDLSFFPTWVRRRLDKAGVPNGARFALRVDRAREDRPTKVPRRNLWKQLIGREAWKRFEDQCRTQVTGASLTLPDEDGDSCIRVSVGGVCRDGGISTGSFVLDTAENPQDHAVYRKLRTKAKQIQTWTEHGTTFSPLVLVVGSDEGVCGPTLGGVGITAEQALHAAFLDAREEHFVTIYNHARYSPPIVPNGKRSRDDNLFVSQSRCIAAVLLVSVENDLSNLGMSRRRRAIAKLLVNRRANHPLDERQIKALKGLSFEHVKYGPGWEAWSQTGPIATDDCHKRLRKEGGEITMAASENFIVELPTSALEMVLSGEFTAKEYWERFRPETLHALRRAVQRGQRIEALEFVQGDPLNRVASRVRLSFGPPRPPVLRAKG